MNTKNKIWIYLLSQYGNALQNLNPSVILITRGKDVCDDPTEMNFKNLVRSLRFHFSNYYTPHQHWWRGYKEFVQSEDVCYNKNSTTVYFLSRYIIILA